MALEPQTREFLSFLRQHPDVRGQIAARPDATILYAGQIIKPAWKEIREMKQRLPQLAAKQTLPEVLETVKLAGHPYPDLLAWAQAFDQLNPALWKENGFIVWRTLSGIFASNARGSVSFVVGSGVSRAEKVFAATEVAVLARNPNIDELTRDLLGYYQRCIAEGRVDMNVSFIAQ